MAQGVELLQNTKPPKGKQDNCGAHKGVEKMRRSVWGRCGGLNLAIRRKAKLDCVKIIIVIFKKSPSKLVGEKNQYIYKYIYIYQWGWERRVKWFRSIHFLLRETQTCLLHHPQSMQRNWYEAYEDR